MEAIPQDGSYLPAFTMKAPDEIASGTYFERGDVLVGKITPSFENGKQALVQELAAPFGYATTEVIPLHPRSDQHDPRLLFFYLLHPDVRHYVTERMEGSTGRKRVPENVLLDLPIPAIDPKDQLAIADALEAIQRASALEAHCERASWKLKRAAMRELFARGLRGEPQKETEIGTMPENWQARPIVDLCEIQSGGTPRKSVADYWIGEIPWASGKDLKVPTLHDTIDHVSREGAEAGSRIAPTDAVLILVRGMGLAKDLPVAVISRPMAFNQDLKALVSRGEFSGTYIRSAIHCAKDRLLSRIVPSAHGTMTLNLDDIETFRVPCPSDPTEADEIVEILNALDRKIDLHKRKRALLENLFKALLHKLMTGEIRVADLDLSALGKASLEGVAA
ncbi:MAG: restriction endonuclease subunit S [Brevundimonas sp.]|nr:MAG: restriction endonuclease subunit S [Brevundimonas sp.]